MTQPTWTEMDTYFNDLFIGSDPALDSAMQVSSASGLPAYAVSPTQGKLLFLLAQIQGARSILELGTLGGYSTIWLARALPPDGTLVTLEASPKHAEVAHANIANAGLADRVEFRVGSALDTLPQLAAEGRAPFDLVFIDADKENNPSYFTWALKLSRRGSVIIVDNVVRDGAVLDAASVDPVIRGIRRFHEMLAAEPRVTATAIQTVGSKGYDGFILARVITEP
jgi:predicted O-methyltransferase YrrM